MTSNTYDPLAGRTFWNEQVRVTPTYVTTYMGQVQNGTQETRELMHAVDHESADFVSSLMSGPDILHEPALDLDFRAAIRTDAAGQPVLLLDCGAENYCVYGFVDALHAHGIITPACFKNMEPRIVRAFSTSGESLKIVRMPPIELAVPAALIPSSTPGHYHLYLGVVMPWKEYQDLLNACHEAKVIATNFLDMAIKNKMTLLLKPDLRKSALAVRRTLPVPTPVGTSSVRPVDDRDVGS